MLAIQQRLLLHFFNVFFDSKALNKDSLALQIKLNELIASSNLSSNSIVEEENLKVSHSIDEVNKKHNLKEKTPKNTKPTTGKTKTTEKKKKASVKNNNQ